MLFFIKTSFGPGEKLVPVQITSVHALFHISAATWTRTVLFWVIKQRVAAILTDVSGKIIDPELTARNYNS
jgi:hypothetical protein